MEGKGANVAAGTLSPRSKGGPTGAGRWLAELERWSTRVEKCVQKPGRRRIHSLRAATLRIEAELGARAQFGVLGNAASRAAERWARRARRVRKLLGPVRDADVCLELLKTLRGPGADTAGEESPVARDCLYAIAHLERAFRCHRAAACRRMKAALRAQQARIAAVTLDLERTLAAPATKRFDRRAALLAVAEELAASVPGLAPATLHSFRKRAKAGRYLAERAPLHDACAQQIGQHCRSIQTAIGQWRDWRALAENAERLLPHREGHDLVRMLTGIAACLRDEALRKCQQASAGLADRPRSQQARHPMRQVKRKGTRRAA